MRTPPDDESEEVRRTDGSALEVLRRLGRPRLRLPLMRSLYAFRMSSMARAEVLKAVRPTIPATRATPAVQLSIANALGLCCGGRLVLQCSSLQVPWEKPVTPQAILINLPIVCLGQISLYGGQTSHDSVACRLVTRSSKAVSCFPANKTFLADCLVR